MRTGAMQTSIHRNPLTLRIEFCLHSVARPQLHLTALLKHKECGGCSRTN
jgi:hypothetical protein